jgi:hypothetical protein
LKNAKKGLKMTVMCGKAGGRPIKHDPKKHLKISKIGKRKIKRHGVLMQKGIPHIYLIYARHPSKNTPNGKS